MLYYILQQQTQQKQISRFKLKQQADYQGILNRLNKTQNDDKRERLQSTSNMELLCKEWSVDYFTLKEVYRLIKMGVTCLKTLAATKWQSDGFGW